MKEATINDIELGNLLFGNSRGKYAVERDEWQEPFVDFLHRNGFDMYGYYERGSERCFENNVFVVRPYYWGEDEEIAVLPNFEFKPTGFTISWYKYPMRNAFASHNISTREFIRILKECEKSMDEVSECLLR